MYYRQMLIEYAQNNDPEGVKDILFKAKSIPKIYDTMDDSGNTVLHHASFRGNIEICKILIESGSDLYAMDKVRSDELFTQLSSLRNSDSLTHTYSRSSERPRSI